MHTLLVTAALMIMAPPLKPGDTTRSLTVDDRQRSYIVHVPGGYDPAKPTPVVLAFHGGGSNAADMVGFCGLNDKSNDEGFLVVYPNGTGRVAEYRTFNGGNCCGYAQRQNIDDVKFVRLLLDDLVTVANIAPRRVYATGMSNGAVICYRLADELSDRIAAIAPVAGPMGKETCSPKRPVPVIHFHGTEDKFAPYVGGVGTRSLSRTKFFSVQHSIDQWARANNCPDKPRIEQLPNKTDDGMTVERITYGPGRDGAEVVLITIKGGGHTWPGRVPPLVFLGPTTIDISANDLMWDFFKRHPMPDKVLQR